MCTFPYPQYCDNISYSVRYLQGMHKIDIHFSKKNYSYEYGRLLERGGWREHWERNEVRAIQHERQREQLFELNQASKINPLSKQKRTQ